MRYTNLGSDQERKPLLSGVRAGILKSTAKNESSTSNTTTKMGIPRAQLVDPHEANCCKLPQHIAALAATLGLLIAGTTIGWSAPVMFKITKPNSTDYNFEMSSSQANWVSSIPTLGSAFICFPIGLIMDRIGRKTSMLLLVIPLTLGWSLITFSTSVNMLIAGRFITGAGGGAFYVTAPAYVSEISQDSNRGHLGTYFQFLLNLGILFSYVVGSFASVFVLNILCTSIPIIFAIIFFFMPESPNFLVKKCKYDAAKKSLIWLRNRYHNVDNELNKLKFKSDEANVNSVCYLSILTKKNSIKALTICWCLILFHQLCGLIAVIFNASEIFFFAGILISPEMATIMLGLIQAVAPFVASLVMDRLGRRILLLFSSISMSICATSIGVYFFLQQTHGNEAIQDITWLPLVSLLIYVTVYNIGLGPIPWIMIGDLCRIEIKAFVGSMAGTLNWLLAFAVTSSFHPLNRAIGVGQLYWLSACITFIGFLFIFFVVFETKGKSIEEIQVLLGGEPEETRSDVKK